MEPIEGAHRQMQADDRQGGEKCQEKAEREPERHTLHAREAAFPTGPLCQRVSRPEKQKRARADRREVGRERGKRAGEEEG